MNRRHLLTPLNFGLLIGLLIVVCLRPDVVPAPAPEPVALPACQGGDQTVPEGGIGDAVIGFPGGLVITLP